MCDDILFEAILRQAVIDEVKSDIRNYKQAEQHVFSEAHEMKMRKLFKSDRSREFFKVAVRRTKVAVAALAVSVTIFFAMLLTISAQVREAVNSVIVTWFSQFTTFSVEQRNDDFIEREWEITYIPEGFELDGVVEMVGSANYEYKNANGERVFIMYMTEEHDFAVDNEDREYSIFELNDVTYYIFAALLDYKDHMIVWDNKGYRFAVIGNCDLDELGLVALSIMEKA